MHSIYEQLNNKLKKEIIDLKNEIRKQKNLFEFVASGGGMGTDGGGIDPAYSGTLDGSQQNKGYIAGMAPGDSSAIPANPTVILQTAKEKLDKLSGIRLGAFTFSGTPTKPHYSSNIGSGMGFGVSDTAFGAARDIISRYAPDEMSPYQNYDNEQLGYLAWTTLNKAGAVQRTENLRGILQQWGLDSEDLNTYNVPPQQPTIGPDYYSTQDPGVGFARKIQKMEKRTENENVDNSERNVGRKVNKITNRLVNLQK